MSDIRVTLKKDEVDALRTITGLFFKIQASTGINYLERADRLKNIFLMLDKKWLNCFQRKSQLQTIVTLKYADAVCLWEYAQEIPCHASSDVGLAIGKIDQAIKSSSLYIESQRLQIH